MTEQKLRRNSNFGDRTGDFSGRNADKTGDFTVRTDHMQNDTFSDN